MTLTAAAALWKEFALSLAAAGRVRLEAHRR
jgi:hypothetical protein